MSFKLTDLQQLDDVSYDDVDKILAHYEDTRAIIEHRLEKIGSLKDRETYARYDDLLDELPQYKEIKRRRAIAKQIMEAELGKNDAS